MEVTKEQIRARMEWLEKLKEFYLSDPQFGRDPTVNRLLIEINRSFKFGATYRIEWLNGNKKEFSGMKEAELYPNIPLDEEISIYVEFKVAKQGILELFEQRLQSHIETMYPEIFDQLY